MVFVSLMIATLVSEDAASVAAGLLIREGRIGAAAGVAACGLGILLGDLGLWGAGRAARRLPLPVAIARWFAPARAGHIVERLRQQPGPALLASRFLPGSRLPLYVAAGLGGVPATAFVAWTLMGVLIWTPVLVLSAAGLTAALTPAVSAHGAGAWPVRALVLAGTLGLLWLARCVIHGTGASPPARLDVESAVASHQPGAGSGHGREPLPCPVRGNLSLVDTGGAAAFQTSGERRA
jgi:membrane protein DedA with SNARE-associated domain